MTERKAMRVTVLKHGGLRVGVTTYKEPFGDGWRTVLSAYEGDNPSLWNLADTEAEANKRHAEAVRMVKLMGFEEAS